MKKINWLFLCVTVLLFVGHIQALAQAPFSDSYQDTSSSKTIKKNPPSSHSDKLKKFRPYSVKPKKFIKSVKKRIADGRKQFKKRKKTKSRLNTQEDKLILFQWLNEQQVSLQWAGSNIAKKDFDSPEGFAPALLKKEINFDTFANDRLFFLNFQQNIIQFPYVLKWGLRTNLGVAFNYDNEHKYFFPMSLSVILSLQIFKHQALIPFFEMGASTWNIGFYTEKFTHAFPFWSIGTSISLALLKNSLRYTLPDEYGIKDIGVIMELRRYSSPLKWLNPWFDDSEKEWPWTKENRGYFLTSFHVGIYCRF